MTQVAELADRLAALVRRAGDAILKIYETDFEVETKADQSPITAADQAANRVLAEGLTALTPGIPILSEELEFAPLEERRGWQRFWLVDPLDGTKEFVDRNGEFTVNVALIENGVPSVGVVGVPVTGEVYFGSCAAGAEPHAWLEVGGARQAIRVRSLGDPVVVVCSRRHRGEQLQALLAAVDVQFPRVQHLAVGSSLKLVRLAEGRADFYPRIGPTSQWDIGAGHAILLGAGGQLVQIDGQPFRYDQQESFLNPDFLAWGDASCDWRKLAG